MATTAQVEDKTFVPMEKELEQRVSALTYEVQSFEITTAEQMKAAAEKSKTIKAQMEEVDSAFDDLIKEAHSHHKNLIARKNKYWKPLSDALALIKRLMGRYEQAEEEKRRQLERELAAEAKRKADEQALAEAARLEKEGDSHGANQVLEEAMMAPAPVVVAQKTTPKVEGVSYRSVWRFRIKDITLIPDQYKIVDEQAVGQIVRAMKKNAEKLMNGGIEVYEEKSTIIR